MTVLHRPYIPIPTTPHRHYISTETTTTSNRTTAGRYITSHTAGVSYGWRNCGIPAVLSHGRDESLQAIFAPPSSSPHVSNHKHWFTTHSSPHLPGSLTSSTVPRLVKGWRTASSCTVYSQNLHRHPTLTAHRYHNNFKENDRCCITSYNAAGVSYGWVKCGIHATIFITEAL